MWLPLTILRFGRTPASKWISVVSKSQLCCGKIRLWISFIFPNTFGKPHGTLSKEKPTNFGSNPDNVVKAIASFLAHRKHYGFTGTVVYKVN